MRSVAGGRPVVAAALTLAALTATGCGSDTVDTSQVESGIEKNLSTSGVQVTSADCPSDVKKEKGDTFDCSVKLSNGATGEVTVTQESGKRYSYAFKPGSVQIPGASVAAVLEEDLAAEGIDGATVTCPETIIVKVGTTVTCDVSGAQGLAAGTVTFTFSSDDGAVDSDSVETGS